MTTHDKIIKISTTISDEALSKLQAIALREGVTIQELILSELKLIEKNNSFANKVSDTYVLEAELKSTYTFSHKVSDTENK